MTNANAQDTTAQGPWDFNPPDSLDSTSSLFRI